MIEVRAADLTGGALNWAVDAVITGKPLEVRFHRSGSGEWIFVTADGIPFPQGPSPYSSDWSHCGPLRDKYHVSVQDVMDGLVAAGLRKSNDGERVVTGVDVVGRTAPEAICRAIVAAKIGAVLKVPAVLRE